MTDLFDDPDVYDDILFAKGTHLVWGFSLQPWDATGSTVAFVLNGTSFPMSFALNGETTDFGPIKLSPAQTLSTGLVNTGDVGTYSVIQTWADGTIQRIGHGEVLVT